MARYWFTPKRYGYGATPLTWQGWAFTVGTIAVILALAAVMPVVIERAGLWGWLVWATILAGVLVAVTTVSRRKTDGEWRWRWGDAGEEGRVR